MQCYVEEKLKRHPGHIEKSGRPLLHYAAWFPNTPPSAKMAAILLKARAEYNGVFGTHLETMLDSLPHDDAVEVKLVTEQD
jgi:hypothetical protein